MDDLAKTVELPDPIEVKIKEKAKLPIYEQSLEVRKACYKKLEESGKLKGVVPVICFPKKGGIFDKNENIKNDFKFFVREEGLEASVMLFSLRKQLKDNVDASHGLFLFVADKNILVTGAQCIVKLYNQYKDESGFLFLSYNIESTFG